MPDDIQAAVAASVFGDDDAMTKPVVYGELFPLVSGGEKFEASREVRVISPSVCPKCGSTDVLSGAVVLGCNACGWNKHSDHPCDVCGKPSTGSCGANGKTYHGCADHPAFERFKSMLTETKAEVVAHVPDLDSAVVAILEREGCPAERISALKEVVGRLREAGYDAAFDVHGNITIDTTAKKLPLDEAERIMSGFEVILGGFDREYDRPGLPVLKLKEMERAVARTMLRPHRAHRPPITGATTPAPRNTLCPCGSGKKFKKCHGRAKR